MDLIELIIVLAVVGFLVWAVLNFVPMEPTIRKLLIGVVCIVLVLWILQQLGLLPRIPLPNLRE